MHVFGVRNTGQVTVALSQCSESGFHGAIDLLVKEYEPEANADK